MQTRVAIFIFAFLSAVCFAAHDESIVARIKQADEAKLRDQPVLYAKIAESQLKATDTFYKDGKYDDAHNALANIVKYSEKSSDTAIRSGNKLKETEITLRRIADKLRDIKRSVEFEEQAPIQGAIDHLEQCRTQILSHMFRKGPK